MPLTQLDERSALVTIDFQNLLRTLPLIRPLDDVVAQAARLAAAFRTVGLPVIHVRASFSPDFADALRPRADTPIHLSDLAVGWDEYLNGLGIESTDLLITKRQFGAFYGTDLDLQLRRRRIAGIVLSGVATSIGIESTARAAAEHGYNIAIATDAVTDVDPTSHAHSLGRILPLFCELDTADEVVAKLAER